MHSLRYACFLRLPRATCFVIQCTRIGKPCVLTLCRSSAETCRELPESRGRFCRNTVQAFPAVVCGGSARWQESRRTPEQSVVRWTSAVPQRARNATYAPCAGGGRCPSTTRASRASAIGSATFGWQDAERSCANPFLFFPELRHSRKSQQGGTSKQKLLDCTTLHEAKQKQRN